MTGLFGFIANRSDVGARALSAEAAPVETSRAGEASRWGLGYFHNDEILLRRRPNDPRSVIPVSQMVEGIQAGHMIGHFGTAAPATMDTNDTHPFRYGSWLFAHTGTIDPSVATRNRYLAALPGFLRAAIRGETCSELLFNLFLAQLHAQGNLQRGTAQPSDVRDALRAMLAQAEGVADELGMARPELDVLVAGGQVVVAAITSRTMLYRVLLGNHLEDALGLDGIPRRRASDWANARVTLFATHVARNAAAYRSVPARSLLTLTRKDDPVCEPIDDRRFTRVAA